MLASELKDKIGRIWNTFWANGMTNPLTVMEQITFLLFMKLLDDNQIKLEANASRLRVTLEDPVFGPHEQGLRWSRFHDLEPNALLAHVTDKVFPFIKTIGKGRDSAYSRYMADATFEIKTAKVLAVVVAEIDAMDLHGKDLMGDVYEELLDRVKSSGENGQFRSPTHIIEMMVEMMEPKPDDTMCDPAFGTAGFLVAAAKYVQAHYEKELLNKKTRAHFKRGMFAGFDIDKQMLRIGAMNLMLHGVEEPDVRYNNSIAADGDTPRNAYTLVMANPPFAGNMTEIDIAKDLLAITKTKKTELLFGACFTRLLTVGGRCAAIVPQGVLFGSSKAHVSLRKELVDGQRLDAVLSMPSGVFKPYAGVATAILVFHKTDHGGTKEVFFYDMRADGFSLDDKREPVAANDIPDVLAKWRRWKDGGAGDPSPAAWQDRKSNCFAVPREEIVENGYDLSFNKYKEVEYVKEVFPPTEELLDEVEGLVGELARGLEGLKELRV